MRTRSEALNLAAPDLLHALRIAEAAASAVLDPEHFAHGRIDWRDLRETFRAAIAKAEGNNP